MASLSAENSPHKYTGLPSPSFPKPHLCIVGLCPVYSLRREETMLSQILILTLDAEVECMLESTLP